MVTLFNHIKKTVIAQSGSFIANINDYYSCDLENVAYICRISICVGYSKYWE